MESLYKQSLPFEYEMYKKTLDIPLSDEVKNELNHFYNRVSNINGSIDDEVIAGLKDEYEGISGHIIAEIRKSGNKKSTHVLEEIQFIFACSYQMIKGHGVSQKTLASIWGMRENQFSKLDIYPDRSRAAYEKDDYRSLNPLREEPEGVRIAKFINKNIQAVHACYGFIGVTNDLDIFANISSTDRKFYILTEPSAMINDDAEMQLKYSLAHSRFLFATGNNLENKVGNYHAGDIKGEIRNLLKMADSSILEKSEKISKMLLEGDEYINYLATADVYGFQKELCKYRGQMEMLSYINKGRSPDDVVPDEVEYDEYLAGIGIDIKKIDIEDITAFTDYLKENTKRLRSRLARCLSYGHKREFDKDAFCDWRQSLLSCLVEKINCEPTNADFDGGGELRTEGKIREAAIFWILDVFGIDEVTEEQLNVVRKYLESKRLLAYMDAINKEVNKGKKPHVFFLKDDFNMQEFLKESLVEFGNSIRPLLVYIDTEAYISSKHFIEGLVEKDKQDAVNVVLVVHDTGGLAKEYGLQVLDEDLKLYVKEGCYGNI